MPKDAFYFDPPGPHNYKAPWLTFSHDPLRPEPRRGIPIQVAQRETDPFKSSGSVELPRNRQRPKCRPKPRVISLLSSDDERTSDSLRVQESRGKRQKKVCKTTVSIEDVNKGMAAAKRLSRAAAISSPRKKVKRPALMEMTAKQPSVMRHFGTYTNSVELKDRKLLVEMGIISPKRPRLSDPSTLENLAHDTAEWTAPYPAFPKPSTPSSIPPSSFIPLDLD
ncbi:uncharacterized protein F4807DRAFT_455230 [Annulohypoxylon truncatum]|uniref:uncharacterized protein n=1 Tax=Annulohypoxylon truncatum TaxID=327061 RepID=UPI002008ADAF|nr:uncharacterized protein F4807DRAFT_455230 [Annulohypoxylon truncatum]KAI1214779.1 hypothetical protein F4807DRAFT_455230 [Annulohypoxylon truncatum]